MDNEDSERFEHLLEMMRDISARARPAGEEPATPDPIDLLPEPTQEAFRTISTLFEKFSSDVAGLYMRRLEYDDPDTIGNNASPGMPFLQDEFMIETIRWCEASAQMFREGRL